MHNTDYQHINAMNNSTFQNLFGVPMGSRPRSRTPSTAGVPGTTLFAQDQDESGVRTYQGDSSIPVFGQVDWDFLPQVAPERGRSRTVGRKHCASLETGFYQIGNLGFTGFPAGTPVSAYTQQSTLTSFTPKVTLTHDFSEPTERLRLGLSEGFRLGGPTNPIVYGPETVCSADFGLINQTYASRPSSAPDSKRTFELGSKGRYPGCFG